MWHLFACSARQRFFTKRILETIRFVSVETNFIVGEEFVPYKNRCRAEHANRSQSSKFQWQIVSSIPRIHTTTPNSSQYPEFVEKRRKTNTSEKLRQNLSGSWDKPTLSTYNTWMQQSRLQRMYHLHSSEFYFLRLAISAQRHLAENLGIESPVFSHVTVEMVGNTAVQYGFWLRGVQS